MNIIYTQGAHDVVQSVSNAYTLYTPQIEGKHHHLWRTFLARMKSAAPFPPALPGRPPTRCRNYRTVATSPTNTKDTPVFSRMVDQGQSKQASVTQGPSRLRGRDSEYNLTYVAVGGFHVRAVPCDKTMPLSSTIYSTTLEPQIRKNRFSQNDQRENREYS